MSSANHSEASGCGSRGGRRRDRLKREVTPTIEIRLNVIALEIPPLRERLEEVPELIESFCEKLDREKGLPRKSFTPPAVARLQGFMKVAPGPNKGLYWQLRNPDFGHASAMRMVEWPWPQPTSATLAPARSFSSTPRSAGRHSRTRLFR